MTPLEFMQRLAAMVRWPRLAMHTLCAERAARVTALWRSIQGSECQQWVAAVCTVAKMAEASVSETFDRRVVSPPARGPLRACRWVATLLWVRRNATPPERPCSAKTGSSYLMQRVTASSPFRPFRHERWTSEECQQRMSADTGVERAKLSTTRRGAPSLLSDRRYRSPQ
jgi:hypothetical protein